MTDKLSPGSKGWHKRQRIHRHNSFTGHVKMMQVQLRSIIDADSTSDRAKQVAERMWLLSRALGDAIKERIDP